jgi:hypothetical protein
MPNYTYATLTDAQDAVLSRLYNSGIQGQPVATFWTLPELTIYITEALRMWNAYTGFQRGDFPFNIDTVANNGSNWYNLSAQSGSLRPFTVTDQYLVNEIEYHLLEPQTSLTPSSGSPAVWAGSNQFSLLDILNALTQRQNESLTQTGCTITQASTPAVIAKRTILTDAVLDIRRVAWIPISGQGYVPTPLRQSDIWEKQSFDNTWTAAGQGTPMQWMQASEPPPAFDVDRVPAVPGNYDVLTVNGGPTSNATSAQIMAVPDDWSWLPKWGALSDVLSREANAKDVMRSQYCQARFLQDCAILRDAPSILGMQLNGVPIFVDAVKNGDDFNTNWQSQTPTVPQTCYAAGLNIVGFPNPDGVYGILVSVVQNQPVPVNGSDFIQIAKGDFDCLIDEAFHIAMFKSGGAEFERTIPLHQKFLQQATLYNSKLKQYGQFSLDMYGISQREEKRNPRIRK